MGITFIDSMDGYIKIHCGYYTELVTGKLMKENPGAANDPYAKRLLSKGEKARNRRLKKRT